MGTLVKDVTLVVRVGEEGVAAIVAALKFELIGDFCQSKGERNSGTGP